MQIPPQPVLFTNWLCYWLKEESSLSNCQNQFFMKQMFVLIKINIGEKVEFFSSEHSRKWEIYLVFWVAEHMRHMAYSVIEINICSQNLQEIIIYKTIKKNFTAINKGYFKWDYYHCSCFHAQTCTSNMHRLISGIEFQIGQKKPIWNLPRY